MHCNDWILQISKCRSVKFTNQIVLRRIYFFPKSVIHVGWQALSMKVILRTGIDLNECTILLELSGFSGRSCSWNWNLSVIQICVSPTEEAARLFFLILPERQSDKFGNCNCCNYAQHTTTSWWQQQRYDRYERLEKIYNFSRRPEILGLLLSENLTQLASLDPPYLSKDTLKTIHWPIKNNNPATAFELYCIKLPSDIRDGGSTALVCLLLGLAEDSTWFRMSREWLQQKNFFRCLWRTNIVKLNRMTVAGPQGC